MLRDRLADLERRVSRLEASTESVPTSSLPPDSASSAAETETFWALDTLKRTLPPGGAVLFAGAATMADGERYEWQETRPAGDLLDEDWADAAASIGALGHPVRLLLLRAVLHGAHTVADLKTIDEGGTSGQIYHHLRQLLAAGWLRPAGRARYVVPPERVIPLLVIYAGATR